MYDPHAGDEEHAGGARREQSHGQLQRTDAPAAQRHQRLRRGRRSHAVRFNSNWGNDREGPRKPMLYRGIHLL